MSHKPILEKKYLELCEYFKDRKIILKNPKALVNGLQCEIEHKEKQKKLNIYYSTKRNFTYVLSDKTDPELSRLLTDFANISSHRLEKVNYQFEKNISGKKNHRLKYWLGTDESGKGDFFGPVVVAGFVCDDKIIKNLKQMGIQDSKKLTDQKISSISQQIQNQYSDRIYVKILNNNRYNNLYTKAKETNRNLHDILAWLHGSVINTAISKHDPLQGVVIDKFEKKNLINRYVKEKFDFKILQYEQGEEDIAVASASVLARHHLNLEFVKMSLKFKMDFPKGAGSIVKNFSKNFINRWGINNLEQVCKKHFKTYNEIIGEYKNNEY